MHKRLLNLIAFLLIFISFNSKAQVSITRGPYIQLKSDTSVIIKWYTNNSTVSTIKYGITPSGLNSTVIGSNLTTSHEIVVPNLEFGKTYYYGIFEGNNKILGDSSYFFRTQKRAQDYTKIKLWVTGDCGTGTVQQSDTRNSFLNYIGVDSLDGWLLLGDNAYTYGTQAEYQAKFFEVYQTDRIMRQTPIFPSPGNHDYGGTANQPSFNSPYFSIFNTPTTGSLGGVPSGTESYYSYNIGNTHFVSLDSYGRQNPNNYILYDTLSPQITWLKQDLEQNSKLFTVLYWHHPPYTMGSHNSDTEGDLVAIRQNVLPIIERYRVDLIMFGHSHNYERSKLIKGHFGPENSYNFTHIKDVSSAKYDGTPNSCPYVKKPFGPNEGLVYMVAGASGWNGAEQASFPHEALPHSIGSNSGSVLLEIDKNTLKSSFIADNGQILDSYTIVKENIPAADTINIFLNPASYTLKSKLSFLNKWSLYPNQITNSIVINTPLNGMEFRVKDIKGCFDTKYVLKMPNPCFGNLNISQPIDAGSNIKLKTASNLTASNLIKDPNKVLYQSEKSIRLETGFQSNSGVFMAEIKGCN